MDFTKRCYFYIGGEFLKNKWREELTKAFPKIKFHFTKYYEIKNTHFPYLKSVYPIPYLCKISIPWEDRDQLFLFFVKNTITPSFRFQDLSRGFDAWHC